MTAIATAPTDVIREEIERFVDVAQRRSDSQPASRRRTTERYHRSWPLTVAVNGLEFSAALHNASRPGLAFLSSLPIPPDTVVFVRLFSHNPAAPRVPALVRHATPGEHGYLIGCEFMPDNEDLCCQALDIPVVRPEPA